MPPPSATARPSDSAADGGSATDGPIGAPGGESPSWWSAFWRFSRPHTIIGTNLQLLTAYVLAAGQETTRSPSAIEVVMLWVAAMAMNLYIVGLNQITDVAVDRINKPDLPMASGEFTRRAATIIVAATGVIAVAAASRLTPVFFWMVVGIMVIGTLYSLPPAHLKRHPLGAALGIATARGLIGNVGTYLHFNQVMGGAPGVPFHVQALALFTFGFCLTIAIMKDIPDIEGDREYGVRTLAVRMGEVTAFRLSLGILGVCYAVFIVGGLTGSFPHLDTPFWIFHALALIFIVAAGIRVDPRDKTRVYGYYMILWKMFYLEFAVFLLLFGPLAAVLRVAR